MLIVLGLRVGRSKADFERDRSLSTLNYFYLLYPACLWLGPPLLVAGGVTGLICLL